MYDERKHELSFVYHTFVKNQIVELLFKVI